MLERNHGYIYVRQNLRILVQSLEREKLRTDAYSSKSQLDVY